MKVNKHRNVLHLAGFLIVVLIWSLVYAFDPTLPLSSLFTSLLLIVLSYIAMVYDINTKRIPNILVTVMAVGWMMIITVMMFFDIDMAVGLLADSLLGLLTGGGLFLLIYLVSKKGLGGGDVKFMAAAGLYLGFAGTLPAILYGTVLAALTGLTLILLKKIDRKDTMPLVPFLFVGIMITLIT